MERIQAQYWVDKEGRPVVIRTALLYDCQVQGTKIGRHFDLWGEKVLFLYYHS